MKNWNAGIEIKGEGEKNNIVGEAKIFDTAAALWNSLESLNGSLEVAGHVKVDRSRKSKIIKQLADLQRKA